jgi:quercetin dioxygenase-like cupin family protein
VRIVALGPAGRGRDLDAFGSQGVRLGPLARLPGGAPGAPGGGGPSSVALADLAPGGRIGRHPAAGWQVLAVVVGSGWVAGADGVPTPVGVGEAAVWEPGEAHETGTDAGMTVCIVEAGVDPVAALG